MTDGAELFLRLAPCLSTVKAFGFGAASIDTRVSFNHAASGMTAWHGALAALSAYQCWLCAKISSVITKILSRRRAVDVRLLSAGTTQVRMCSCPYCIPRQVCHIGERT